MSDTAISPGVGAIVATGNDPVGVRGSVVQPTTGGIESAGASVVMGFGVAVGVGAIESTGMAPSGGMWNETTGTGTVWTVLP